MVAVRRRNLCLADLTQFTRFDYLAHRGEIGLEEILLGDADLYFVFSYVLLQLDHR